MGAYMSLLWFGSHEGKKGGTLVRRLLPDLKVPSSIPGRGNNFYLGCENQLYSHFFILVRLDAVCAYFIELTFSPTIYLNLNNILNDIF